MGLAFFLKFEFKKAIEHFKVGIKYSIRDLICGVIKYSVCSCDHMIKQWRRNGCEGGGYNKNFFDPPPLTYLVGDMKQDIAVFFTAIIYYDV